jgi:hypothetical protein
MVLAAVACVTRARAAGIDSDSKAERALGEEKPARRGSTDEWFGVAPTESGSERVDPPLTEKELRELFPDLEVETTHSSPLKVSVGVLAPFQLYGLGLGTDMYVSSRLRVNAIVSFGMTLAHPYRRDWELNTYAEAGLGVVALRWNSHATVAWPDPRRLAQTTMPERHALVPSAHSIEVEAGVLSGHAVLFRCTADCMDPSSASTYDKAALQVTMPYAGLRYVYFRRATSRRAGISVAQRFQLAVHLVTRPFVQPDANLLGLSTDPIARYPLGFRLVSHLPLAGCTLSGICGGLDVGVGFLPSPASPYLTVGGTYF